MGNVHEVTQTEPFRSSVGAAIPLQPGTTLIEDTFPSYCSLGTASRAIGRSRVPAAASFLVIGTGGKWGYDHDFEQFLAANAPVLQDAVFYVSDEYAMYVREWRIKDGELTVEFAAPDNSHVGLVLVDQGKHRDFGLELLEEMLDGMMWDGGDSEEPASIRHRAVTTLVVHRPDRWQTWHQLGLLKAGYAASAAHEAFARALAIVPADKRSIVEVGDLRALQEIDPKLALALGRARFDAWVRDAMAESGYFNAVADGLQRYAQLEQAHGTPELAARAYVGWLRTNNDRASARRFYNIACLRSLGGQLDSARDWLRLAMLVEPALATAAAADADLAACGDVTALADPDRDPS